MIQKRTVLILGAGASAPYGFPLGQGLLNDICNTLFNKEDMKKLFWEMGFDEEIRNEFIQALRFSGRTSVDAFLEHRKEFLDVGKAAIAAALIPFERHESLFPEDLKWYQYLFMKLNTSFEEFDLNLISIITFNYDRLIEHYLFTALKNSYGQSDERCAEKLSNIPIIHLYGRLGYLPWLSLTT